MDNAWGSEQFLRVMRELLRKAEHAPDRKERCLAEAAAINCLELALEQPPQLVVIRK